MSRILDNLKKKLEQEMEARMGPVIIELQKLEKQIDKLNKNIEKLNKNIEKFLERGG